MLSTSHVQGHLVPMQTHSQLYWVFVDYHPPRLVAEMQAEVRKGHGPAAHVLGLLLYSDGTETVSGHHFHPVVLYIANYQLEHLRSRNGGRRLALLPILDKDQFKHLSDIT